MFNKYKINLEYIVWGLAPKSPLPLFAPMHRAQVHKNLKCLLIKNLLMYIQYI